LSTNGDRLKLALEEASKARAEAEAHKPRQIATNATIYGQREEEELRRALNKLGKAKIESCIIQKQL
jgi:hypothetical protein